MGHLKTGTCLQKNDHAWGGALKLLAVPGKGSEERELEMSGSEKSLLFKLEGLSEGREGTLVLHSSGVEAHRTEARRSCISV